MIIILGTFSQAAFTPIITYHRIGFSNDNFSIDLKIQYYCLFLLFLFILLNLNLVEEISKRRFH
jgi:hypothetical protein